jgi:hypothetical protein
MAVKLGVMFGFIFSLSLTLGKNMGLHEAEQHRRKYSDSKIECSEIRLVQSGTTGMTTSIEISV